MVKKILSFLGLSCSLMGYSVCAATTGSYMKAAQSLSPSSSEKVLDVTLTAQYDPDDRTYDWDWGVYYVKIKVGKGKTFSIWCDTKSDESMSLLADFDPDDDKLYASADSYWREGAELYVLTPDCWDEDDPSSGTFYFYVDGNVGATCKLHYTSSTIDGEAWEGEEEIVVGTAENPKSITLTEAPTTFSGSLIDGSYYYVFNGLANRAYRFHTVGGTTNKTLSVYYDDTTALKDPEVLEDLNAGVDENNGSLIIRTAEAGRYYIYVDGDASSSFKLVGNLVKARTMTDHLAEVKSLPGSNPATATFAPGYLSAWADYWDPIIDENLYTFSLGEGERVICETSGSATNLLMRLYDAKGNIVAENRKSIGLDAYVAYVGKPGTYYVGVCQDGLEFGEVAGTDQLTLTVTKVGLPEISGDPDAADFADDTFTGATEVFAAISNDDEHEPTNFPGSVEHALSLTDWEDNFKIACQRGITYRFQTAASKATSLNLYGELYTVTTDSKGKTTERIVREGLISDGIEYKTTSSMDCYLRVYVAEGRGRVYPGYALHAIAFVPDQKLGYLTVNIMGAGEATWTYKNPSYSDTVKRVGGMKVLTWGSNTITFSAVTGFITPSPVTHTLTGDEAVDVVTGAYKDTSDPKDDNVTGTYSGTKKYAPVAISPSAKGARVSRSLLIEDPRDWFSFTAAAGVYYRFELANAGGTPRVRVFGPNDSTLPCDRALYAETNTLFLVLAEQKGTYYVCVDHAEESQDDWQDSAYTLVATSVNVGAVKCAKAAVTFKKNTAYAAVTVNRTAKDGRVRVKYRTVDGTAKAGVDYNAVEGVLEWANGQNAAKTIQIKLIPQIYNAYTGNKDFSVELETFAESEIDEDEYIPARGTPMASTVTVSESVKKAPGTITAAYDGEELTSKTATVVVKAGEKFVLDLAREVSADGVVGVKVATAAGTAKAGIDFMMNTATNVWADGEMSGRTFTVETKPFDGSFVAEKKFTVKITKLTGKNADGVAYDAPKIPLATVTVLVRNEKFDQTVAEFTKANTKELKAAGVAIKESKSGLWYVKSGDILASAKADLTYTLTGPGVFKTTAIGGLSYLVGKDKTVRTAKAGEAILLYLGAGSQTVKFTAEADAGLAAGADYAKVWTPLPLATALAPSLNKAVLPMVGAELKVDIPEAADAVRVYCLGPTATKGTKLGADETLVEPDGEGRYMLKDLVAGGKYTWRADSCILDGDGTVLLANTNKTAWSFTATTKDSAPQTVIGGLDVHGESVQSNVGGAVVTLRQGVTVALSNEVAGASYKLFSGKLPDGVKIDAKTGRIAGVPTKSGIYEALLQVTDSNKVAGATAALKFMVEPMTSAAGTFNGVLFVQDDPTRGLARLGSLAFTSTTAGSLSGKVMLAGKTYTFAKKTGFDQLAVDSNGVEAVMAKIPLVTKVGKVPYTNVLEVAVQDSASLTCNFGGMATLKMSVPAADGKSVAEQDEELAYEATLYRDNSKEKDALDLLAGAQGYYTAILAPLADGEDPKGNGYLALTIDAKGKAKVTGVLADGTKLSSSVAIGYDFSDLEIPQVIIPVYFCKSPYVFGGELVFMRDVNVLGEDCLVIDSSTSRLEWCNDNAATTYSGTDGYQMEIEPVGGWYNTVFNLQGYYNSYDFLVGAGESDELPEEFVPAGYSLVADCWPTDYTLDCAVNAVVAAKRTLVSKEGQKAFYDFAASINPCNVTITYKRATGLINGQFSIWGENEKGDKEIAKVKHAGMMILSRSASTMLSDDVITGGYYLVPVKLPNGKSTRTWNCSLPFNVKAVERMTE